MADKLPLLVGLDWHMQYIALKIVRSSLEVEKNRILNLLYINQVKSAVAEEERLKCLENEKNENNEKNKKKGESERKEDPKSTPLRRKSLGQMPRKGSKGMPQILISQTYNNNNNNNNNDDDDDNSVITISTMNTLRTMKSIGTIGTVGTMRANQQNKQNSNQSNNPTRRNSGDSSHITKIGLLSQSFVSPPADVDRTQCVVPATLVVQCMARPRRCLQCEEATQQRAMRRWYVGAGGDADEGLHTRLEVHLDDAACAVPDVGAKR